MSFGQGPRKQTLVTEEERILFVRKLIFLGVFQHVIPKIETVLFELPDFLLAKVRETGVPWTVFFRCRRGIWTTPLPVSL